MIVCMPAISDRTTSGDRGCLRGPVHHAAAWRKRLRRELLRLRAGEVSLYIDGPRGVAHVRFPQHADRYTLGVDQALRSLRSLPDGAGVQATQDALTRG